MRFARDIRQQLERIIGHDGSGLEAGGRRRRHGHGGGGEGRQDEQHAAEGQQQEGGAGSKHELGSARAATGATPSGGGEARSAILPP